MSREDERTRAQAAAERAVQSVRIPQLRPGTVVEGGPRPTVQMDDSSIVFAQCLTERPSVGQRVSVMFTGTAAFVTGLYGGSVHLLGKATLELEPDPITTETELDLRVGVTISAPNREIEVWTKVYCEADAADIGAQTRVYEVLADGTLGDPIGGFTGRTAQAYVPVINGNFMLTGFVSEVPDVGDRTYGVTVTRTGGAGTVTVLAANTPAELIVRDVGASGES